MASPQRMKMSLFPETTYGTAVTTGGRAYQVTSDGTPTPQVQNVDSSGAYSGRQALVDEAVETLTTGWDLSMSAFARTNGFELWLQHAIGAVGAAPAQVAGSTSPPLYTKVFHSNDVGPTGSYTIVLDRFTQTPDPDPNTLTRSTYPGAMVKGWGLSISSGGDSKLELTTDYLVRGPESDTAPRVATALPAAYASATNDENAAFTWRDCGVKVGAKSAALATLQAAADVRRLRQFSYTHDTMLKDDQHYLQRSELMDKPYANLMTGQVSLSFDYDTAHDSIYNAWVEGTQQSLLFEAVRRAAAPGTTEATQYALRLWLPDIYITSATRTQPIDNTSTLSVEGQLRWDKTNDAVTLHYVTEGSTIP